MTRRPLVIAHRGASARAPDNSLEAIAIADEQGADGVEIDVRLTSDGTIVLTHDVEVPGAGAVHSTTYRELRAARPSLARLDDVLDAGGNMLLNIEIKTVGGDPGCDPLHRLADALAAWIADAGVATRCLVSSFDPATLRRFREAARHVETGLLIERRRDVRPGLVEATDAGHAWLLPRRTAFLPRRRRLTARAQRRGLRTGSWTVDRPGEIRALAEAGVDAVITNDPAAALAALA